VTQVVPVQVDLPEPGAIDASTGFRASCRGRSEREAATQMGIDTQKPACRVVTTHLLAIDYRLFGAFLKMSLGVPWASPLKAQKQPRLGWRVDGCIQSAPATGGLLQMEV
jgi:hypothetical protein